MMNSGVKVLQQETEKPTEKSLSQLILSLLNPKEREEALAEFSKRKDDFGPNLAPILWYSTGVIAVLIQEIVSVYGSLSPPTLQSSNRVCHVLALLQPIASHPDTRPLFLNAHIPLFLYPFLNTVSNSVPFEYLRLTSLGVIGALVKTDDQEVIKFLLSTEIIPLCLRIMETGGELSQTVATFIVHKIISVDVGLGYTCATADRFYAVSSVLAQMVKNKPTSRLLRHIVRCYLRLSDHRGALDTLKNSLPSALMDDTFEQFMNEDAGLKKLILELRNTLNPQF